MMFFWLALFTVLSGIQQGIITWLFREYVPPTRQSWINAALHKGGVLFYGCYVGALAFYKLQLLWPSAQGWHQWLVAVGMIMAEALLARVVFFDVLLNLTRAYLDHKENRPPGLVWAVGSSASSDKFILWYTSWYSLHVNPRVQPQQVRFASWLLSVAATIIFLIFT